jgi:cation diffusion facilitator CzcD-associated flavoprotein CzcO
MHWNEEDEHWEVATKNGFYRARVLITAVGRLSEPRIPQLPGLGSARGDVFHSSRWRHDAMVDGRRIAVVGTGASAVQIVPRLAPKASSVVVFQRNAPYVLPRNDRAYESSERRSFEGDLRAVEALRSELFVAAEEGFAARAGAERDLNLLRARAQAHLRAQISDPTLIEQLTPNYEIGCKRVLLSDDFYPALTRDNVFLEASGLAEITGQTLRAANGRTHEYDVLVLATGFHTSELPFAERVYGSKGQNLAERWRGGMEAFASTVVHGFPNLFILDGPNAALGHNSAIYMIETQIDYILGALKFQAGTNGRPLDVSSRAERAYMNQVATASRGMVWETGGCTSWYLDPRVGRQTLLWPGTARSFREQNGTFDPSVYGQQYAEFLGVGVAERPLVAVPRGTS